MNRDKHEKARNKAEKQLIIRNSTAEFLIFTIQAGQDGIEVRVEDENIWLTQKLIAKLFDVRIPTINEHLKNIFSTNELQENSVVRNFLITADDGKQYNTKHYNLEAIIAFGYRINSERATNFRRWATQVLKDFALRGYVLDNVRLKNGAEQTSLCNSRSYCGRTYCKSCKSQKRQYGADYMEKSTRWKNH